MDSDLRDQILTQYDAEVASFEEFSELMQTLLSRLLKENNIPYHSVTSRVKSRSSLDKKISKFESKYTGLYDITDLVGIRITTYFADKVDQVALMIAKEFEVDNDKSIDKRKSLDPDRFGYLSFHHIIKLLPSRHTLSEYHRFENFVAEIQTRSILQHAWAEIEHDLGYKTTLGVPHPIRRRFSRLAGLLELADEEFMAIRQFLSTYSTELTSTIPTTPYDVILDKDSVTQFITTNPNIIDIDQKIASLSNSTIRDIDSSWVEWLLPTFIYLDIKTIGDLKAKLDRYLPKIFPFAKVWIRKPSIKEYVRGITLFYLCYVIVAAKNEFDYAVGYLIASKIGTDEDRDETASKIISSYLEIENIYSNGIVHAREDIIE